MSLEFLLILTLRVSATFVSSILLIDAAATEGLIEEVKSVLDNNYNIEHLDYIGFYEIISYLSNKISLDEAVEKIVIRTRQYAKRQLKWFDIQDFDLIINADNTNSNDIVDKVAQIY